MYRKSKEDRDKWTEKEIWSNVKRTHTRARTHAHIGLGRSSIQLTEIAISISIVSDIATATTWNHHSDCQLPSDTCIVYMPAFWITPFRIIARNEIATSTNSSKCADVNGRKVYRIDYA